MCAGICGTLCSNPSFTALSLFGVALLVHRPQLLNGHLSNPLAAFVNILIDWLHTLRPALLLLGPQINLEAVLLFLVEYRAVLLAFDVVDLLAEVPVVIALD